MKQLELRKLHSGEEFTIAGHNYVVLDKVGHGTLVIESDIIDKYMAFGSTNDWSTSGIRKYLNVEYLAELEENGLKPEMIMPLTIDLKETNGGREYGYDTCNVGLLTLEQYTKYAEFIPLASDWWWLATPWGTPKSRSPNTHDSTSAWRVRTNGHVSNSHTSGTGIGVRPALIFASTLLVSVDTTEPHDKGLSEYTTHELLDEVASRIESASIQEV